MKRQLLTSKSEHWCTPPEFLVLVRDIDDIGLDPCSNVFSIVGAKKAFTLPKHDGLAESWQGEGLVFVNPPYGRALKHWVIKAVDEASKGAEIIMLTPARPDTKWFHEWILPTADALCFVKGRLKFIDGLTGTKKNPATFPSLVSYWGPRADLFEAAFVDAGWNVRLI